MVLRDVQFNLFVYLVIAVIASTFAQNESTLNTTTAHFGNRRTVNRTSTSPYFPHTRRHEVRTPNTTTHFGNRRTINRTSTSPYFPHTRTYEVRAPNTTTNFGNRRRTVNRTSTSTYFPHTRRHEVRTLNTTTHFGNRRTINRTSTSPYFPHTRTYEVRTPNTTTNFGNRRRTVNRTLTSPYFPRTTRHSLPPTVKVNTRRTRTPSRPTTPTYNLTDEMADYLAVYLEYFGKYITSNGSSKEVYGSEYFIGVLMLEIFTMATGNHFVVPPTEDKKLEEKQQESAWAVVQLWLDLSCAEKVNDILKEAIRETLIQYESTREQSAVNKMHESLRTLLNKLNDTIEENDFLSSKYKTERVRYLAQYFPDANTQLKVYFPVDDIARGAVDREALKVWINDPDIRKFFIHANVLKMGNQSSNEDDENRVWARTILKVAKEECCASQMQNLYVAALNETVTNFDTGAPQQKIIRFLIGKVNKSIKVDSVLKNTWTKLENDIREKLQEEEDSNDSDW